MGACGERECMYRFEDGVRVGGQEGAKTYGLVMALDSIHER